MSLEQDLHQEDVIHLDLSDFSQVESGTTVRKTVEKMREEGHSTALIITDQGALKGIFTDRDVLRRVVADHDNWDNPIDEVMTSDPITVNADDSADTALSLMNEKHFRNVPVIDKGGKVVGNLTHYAIIKYLADRFPESVYNLPPDPDQVTDYRAGA